MGKSLTRTSVSGVAQAVPGRDSSVGKERLRLLDLLRLCAALAVVLYHFTSRHPDLGWSGRSPFDVFPGLAPLSSYGLLGVQLFFIISGFVILMSVWGRTPGQFVASRVSRLFPAYWVAVLATGLLLPVISTGLRDQVSPIQVVVNLTMTQEAFDVSAVDGVYWTLWVELCFYLIMGALLLAGMTRGRVVLLAFIWPLVAALAQQADLGLLNLILQPTYAPLFAGGMALYLIYAFGHSWLYWLLLGYNAALSAYQTALHDIPRANRYAGGILDPTLSAAIVVALFALVAVCTLTPIRTRGGRTAEWAGKLTYPLYLIHQYWGLLVISLLFPVLGAWPTLGIAILAVGVMAYLIHRLIEVPLGPRIRRGIEASLRGSQLPPHTPIRAGAGPARIPETEAAAPPKTPEPAAITAPTRRRSRGQTR